MALVTANLVVRIDANISYRLEVKGRSVVIVKTCTHGNKVKSYRVQEDEDGATLYDSIFGPGRPTGKDQHFYDKDLQYYIKVFRQLV